MDPTSAALLRQTTDGLRAVAKAKELVGSRVAPDFRLFDFLRDDEIAISRCLAFLLDDRETHGQGGLYLDSFLRKLGPSIRWASSRVLQRVSVEERISGSGRRIDILLKFAGGNFIGIENKPWARDQEDQLKDYGHHLKYLAENTAEAVGNWCLVYLSNRDPEPSSLNEEVRDAWTKSANYIHLDFRQIVDWLDSCASATEASTVRTFLEQFVQFIRHMVNEEKCMSLEQREVIDTILRSSENIDSAFRVAASVDDVKKKLLSKFEGELRQLIEEDGWELIWNSPEVPKGLEQMATEASFGIAFDPRDDKVLTFEFSKSGLRDMYWGIRCRQQFAHRGDSWDRIRKAMDEKFRPGDGSKDWWPWYTRDNRNRTNDVDRCLLKDKEAPKSVRDWSDSFPWILIHEGVLAKRVKEMARRVHDRIPSELFRATS